MLTETLKVKETKTRYGKMRYYANDQYIGRSLQRYGEYSEQEVKLWRDLLEPGDTVIDVGANIGALTVALADIVGLTGRVIAFEPQPQNFDLLKANTGAAPADVDCIMSALGSSVGTISIPDLINLGHENFGRVMVGEEGDSGVPLVTLDNCTPIGRVAFVKIDVEGFEAEVIRGALGLIKRDRPLLYVENDRPEKMNELLNLIRSLDYRIYEHTPPLFNPDNYKEQQDNDFGEIVSINVLCVPNERVDYYKDITDSLRPVVPATPNQGKKEWIGIARFGGVGDNLIAASVLRPLKKMGYKIEVLTQKPQSVVFENNPHIDKLVVKDSVRDLPQGNMLEWQKWFDSRSREYDSGKCINLSHSCEGTLVPFPAMTSFWWPDNFRRKQYGKSYLETVHDIVDVPYDFGPLFFPTDEEKEDALRLKKKTGDRPVIVWCLNGTRLDKTYPYSPMCVARLINDLKATVVIIGQPAPAKDAVMALTIQDHVKQQNGSTAHVFTSLGPNGGGEDGSWPLRRVLTFAGVADLVIGPDTGPMWSVAFEQVPKILLHSHASVENITKHWLNTTSLHADQGRVPCWPCHRLHDGPETCVQNVEGNGAACISDISVETIIQTASKILKG